MFVIRSFSFKSVTQHTKYVFKWYVNHFYSDILYTIIDFLVGNFHNVRNILLN